MTKDETLKLALEALEGYEFCIDAYYAGAVCPQIDKAITAIKAALAQPEQEPVAWRFKDPKDGHWLYTTHIVDLSKKYWGFKNEEFEPLYTAPPKPEQEPVALVISGALVKSELPENYTGHLYTTPPKRPWVGLTDEDWEPLYDKFAKHQEYGAFVSGWDNFARAIEAKLKEKNT
jgi:hypothetical protein